MSVLRTLSAMAWRNLWRHGRRSALTASAMAVAAAICMSSIALTDGMYAEIFRVLVEQQLGHVIVQHPDYPAKRQLYDTVPDATTLVASLDALDGVEVAAPRLVGFGLVGGKAESAGAQIVGVVPARERELTGLHERVRVGEYLPDDAGQHVVVGAGLAEELGLSVGDEVVVVTQSADGSLGNGLFIVRGVYRSGDAAMDRSGAYVHLADLQELLVLPDQVHKITLLSSDAEEIPALAERVKGGVAEGTSVQTWWEASPSTKQMLDMSGAQKVIMLGIVFTVATFGVVNTMTMSVFERTRELGVLRALGLRPGRLVALVVLESLQLAALAAVAALVLGGALDAYLVFYGLDFSASMKEGFSFAGVTIDPVMKGKVEPSGILLTLGSILVVGVLASLWPAARAARLRPVEAIRTE